MLPTMWLIAVPTIALGAFTLTVAAYRWVFALAYLVRRRTRRLPEPAATKRRFSVLVPAHDEAVLIASTVRSILSADYPAHAMRLIVVADNCNDATATEARAAGAEVFERDDRANPGKGPALDWALSQLDPESYDAIVMLDADVLLEGAFFEVMNSELARGVRVAQGYYGVSNPDESTLTRLMAVTSVMKNLLFNAGKSQLGLSPLLMGTGMVFLRDVIAERGWKARTIAEDYEEGLSLVESGERIHFVEEARFMAQEEPDLQSGYAQHQRWASGGVLLFKRGLGAAWTGVRTANLPLVDVGLEIVSPSYSMLMNITLVAGLLCLSPGIPPIAIGLVASALFLQLAEFALGMILLGPTPRFVASVLFAPVFLVWKLAIAALALVGFRRDRWVRTERRERS